MTPFEGFIPDTWSLRTVLSAPESHKNCIVFPCTVNVRKGFTSFPDKFNKTSVKSMVWGTDCCLWQSDGVFKHACVLTVAADTSHLLYEGLRGPGRLYSSRRSSRQSLMK